jgi:hypothetical protein
VTDTKDPRSIAADEAEFRTTVLVKLEGLGRDVTHIKGTCDETKKALADHIEHDNERFGKVDQRIGTNESGISKGTGILIAIVAMLGVVMFIIEALRP